MRSLCLIAALLAIGAYCTEVETKVNTGGDGGAMETNTKVSSGGGAQMDTQTDIHNMQRRAEMETKMNTGGGPDMEAHSQVDNGNQQMSAQAETHNRFRRWGGYYGGGYGGMGYGGYGRGYGMGYGMRGYGGYGGMGGFYG